MTARPRGYSLPISFFSMAAMGPVGSIVGF
jgi:hypothetical protein